MFDVHLFSSIETFYRFMTFCILTSLVHILGDKAPNRGDPVPGSLNPGIKEEDRCK
jgi:hypothetical protein